MLTQRFLLAYLFFVFGPVHQAFAGTLCMGARAMIPEENVVFIFDLHGVIVHRDYTETMHTAARSLYHHAWFLLTHVFNYPFWRCIYRAIKKTRAAEGIFELVRRDHPELEQVKEAYTAFCNAYSLNQDSLALITALKNKGYPVILCSNVGEHSYTQLIEKLPALRDALTDVFVSRQADGYPDKRHEAFFIKFNQFLRDKQLHEHRKIFIDDSAYKIENAKKYSGVEGVHFTNVVRLRAHPAIMSALARPEVHA